MDIGILRRIFAAGINSVLPNKLVEEALIIENDCLTVKNTGSKYKLNKNVYVVAFGKAACGMSRAAEKALKGHVLGGIASIPVGSSENLRNHNLMNMLPLENSKILYKEGARHNLPDEAAHSTALSIKSLCEGLTADHLLLVLVSGGGSALLPCPPKPINLADKLKLIKLLGSKGADIIQLNTVRQQLSELKGGGLAQIAFPAKVLALIMSDIIGNDLQFIASGSTVKCKTTAKDALHIIRKFCSLEEIPANVINFLNNKIADEKPLSNSLSFDHVENVLLADNLRALRAASSEAKALGFSAYVVRHDLSGEAKNIAEDFADFTIRLIEIASQKKGNLPLSDIYSKKSKVLPDGRSFDEFLNRLLAESLFQNTAQKSSATSVCLLWGGETTVSVHGRGRGGRNQELVLAYFRRMLDHYRSLGSTIHRGVDFAFCSIGSDGQDGPTDAAGALVTSSLLGSVPTDTIDLIEKHLSNNDSYAFFEQFHSKSCHLKIGFTGTNVMDFQILIIFSNVQSAL